MKIRFLLPVILGLSVSLLTNCKPGAKNDAKESEVNDTTKKITDTTATKNTSDSTTANNTKTEEENTDPELKPYLAAVHEEFDNLPSTFEAKYMGFDMGDYPHIIFKIKGGKEYDFGDGANSYGPYKEEDFVAENSTYNGKKFKVTWEWKMSSFSCCDGEMTLKKAKVPSIVNLELIE